ncbi:hypothetical protein, partial [Noviherbaspirillum denitrificans]|uniref:hypothetical protein n=1 Tax=Noviherbaspirillum denitrificans TaxID=1968433 RepID=UPI00197F2DB2
MSARRNGHRQTPISDRSTSTQKARLGYPRRAFFRPDVPFARGVHAFAVLHQALLPANEHLLRNRRVAPICLSGPIPHRNDAKHISREHFSLISITYAQPKVEYPRWHTPRNMSVERNEMLDQPNHP